MKAKSTAAVVGIAAAMFLGISVTASANPPTRPGVRFVGTYPTEKACWAAAADEMGRDPTHINYECALTPRITWNLWIW
ncbi:hypothetical protein [Nocardia sp. NPDC049149]|uniref:hypothetical protein n=1 Tax=Nocardia sp. NPDC049149 TaxID=3364315 RepID=UPI0037175363